MLLCKPVEIPKHSEASQHLILYFPFGLANFSLLFVRIEIEGVLRRCLLQVCQGSDKDTRHSPLPVELARREKTSLARPRWCWPGWDTCYRLLFPLSKGPVNWNVLSPDLFVSITSAFGLHASPSSPSHLPSFWSCILALALLRCIRSTMAAYRKLPSHNRWFPRKFYHSEHTCLTNILLNIMSRSHCV